MRERERECVYVLVYLGRSLYPKKKKSTNYLYLKKDIYNHHHIIENNIKKNKNKNFEIYRFDCKLKKKKKKG